MDTKGRTFKIVEREYGYKNQLVGSKLKDNPLRTLWIYPFIIFFLGFFVWLLFFVTGGFFAFLIGLLFLLIIVLVINQLFQKLQLYFKYGTSILVLNSFPIKSGGELDLTFQNERIVNDFPVLNYELQFLEEKKVRKQITGEETENKLLFKSWYSVKGEFQTNYSGGDILLALPSDLPGNTLYGNPLYYWTLSLEGEKGSNKYSTTFFLPVE